MNDSKIESLMNDFNGFVNIIDGAIKKLEISINIENLIENIDEFKDEFSFHLVLCLKYHKRLLKRFYGLHHEANRLLIEKKRKRQRELIRNMQSSKNIENQPDIGLLNEKFLSSKQIDDCQNFLNLPKMYKKKQLNKFPFNLLDVDESNSTVSDDSMKSEQSN